MATTTVAAAGPRHGRGLADSPLDGRARGSDARDRCRNGPARGSRFLAAAKADKVAAWCGYAASTAGSTAVGMTAAAGLALTRAKSLVVGPLVG